jgi:hypothetical protein
MYVTLSFVLELGVPLAILYGLVPIPGLVSGQRKNPQPDLPPSPQPVETAAHSLADILVPSPQVAVADATRKLEPV